jgi:outer membrane protein assembly factor BamB
MVNKVVFGVGPLTPNDMEDGGYGGPAVAGGKVYLYYYFPDLTAIRDSAEWKKSLSFIRGSPLGHEALGHYLDVVLCLDARTGKTLWRYNRPFFTKGGMPGGKGGRGLTPCVYGGRVFARASDGITCLDVETGRAIWRKQRIGEGAQTAGLGVGATGAGWSREESLVAIGGVLLVGTSGDRSTNLAALNPATGDLLWSHDKARGYNALPSAVTLGGREYILTACGAYDCKDAAYERMLLIDPQTGKILWTCADVGANVNSLDVWGDLVCANVHKGVKTQPGGDDQERPGGFRVALSGATRLWESKDAHLQSIRVTPLAHRGVFYLDSGRTGFRALDGETGGPRGQEKHIYAQSGGDHNWTWCVATDGRIVGSGLLMYDAAPDALKLRPGQLRVPLACGYFVPVLPALADGRIVFRTKCMLVCYDLRKR